MAFSAFNALWHDILIANRLRFLKESIHRCISIYCNVYWYECSGRSENCYWICWRKSNSDMCCVCILCIVWNEWEKSPTVIRFVEVKFTCQSKWRTCDKLFYFRFEIKFYVLQCENCEWIENPQYEWYIKQEYLIHSIALWI